jgi:hypothetical protein
MLNFIVPEINDYIIYREGNKDDLKNLQIFLILKSSNRVGGMNFGLCKCGLFFFIRLGKRPRACPCGSITNPVRGELPCLPRKKIPR